MTGILASIKKLLGGTDEDTHFDGDILIHINTAFSKLRQIGAGPVAGFKVTETSTWSDFLLADELRLEMVKSYVYLKVKLIFDPPLNSSVLDAFKKEADELEWRILTELDPVTPTVIEEVEGGDPIV